MCWMCDHPGSTVADYLDVIRGEILEHGWIVQYVDNPRMPYAYTIGLTDYLLPELLMTGVSAQRAVRLLNRASELILRGRALEPGEQFTLPAGPLLEVVTLSQPDAHMAMAVNLFGSQVRAQQLVWADGRGRWPWAADFCDQESRQPVLGVRARATHDADLP